MVQSERVACRKKNCWKEGERKDSNWRSGYGVWSLTPEWVRWVNDQGVGGTIQNWAQKESHFEKLVWSGLLKRCVSNQPGGAKHVLQHTWRFLQRHAYASFRRPKHQTFNAKYGRWSNDNRLDPSRVHLAWAISQLARDYWQEGGEKAELWEH